MEKIRGVNLGNWLVLEKWMDPAPFAGTEAEDETWLARLLETETLQKRLRAHRERSVTERDFRDIAAAGLNLVRIPVPYFLFGDRHPGGAPALPGEALGCVGFLDRAMQWAEKYGLKVLIDLHTTPGNQNGFDNGGIIGVCKWHTQKEEVQYVLRVLAKICRRYGRHPALFGVEVINEPISLLAYLTAPTTGKARDESEAQGSRFVPLAFLRPFYRAAYRTMRRYLPEEKAIVFHDGFRLGHWRGFFRKNHMKNVWLDAHIYIWAMEKVTHIHRLRMYRLYMAAEKFRLKMAARHVNILVGEWCLCNRWAADLSLLAEEARQAAGEKAAGPAEKPAPDSAKVYASAPGIILARAKEAARRSLPGPLGRSAREKAEAAEKHILEEQKRRFREVAKLQLDTWGCTGGWVYWNWKLGNDTKEALDEYWKESWDFRRCLENGWITEEEICRRW